MSKYAEATIPKDYEAKCAADNVERMMEMRENKKLMAATKKAMQLKMKRMNKAMSFMDNM